MEVFLQFGHSKLRLSGEKFGLSGHTKGFVSAPENLSAAILV